MSKHLKSSSKNVSESMVTNVPIVQENHTLAEVRQHIEKHAKDFNTINYIYVVNAQGNLKGVLSIRQLFQHSPASVASDVCLQKGLVVLHPHDHQEKASLLALKHTIKALPVVDRDNVFLGEVPSDAILSILYTKMHEGTLRRAGIRHPDAMTTNVLDLPILLSVRHRIPWLLLGLLGGLLAANIVGLFQTTLRENLVLASFIPLIVYMSDAVRTQMEAYIIRDLAIRRSLPFSQYVISHLLVVIIVAVLLSLLLTVAFGIFYLEWYIAIVLGLSLFASVTSSVVTGIIVPYYFHTMALDPADASGPIATILQDMMSIVLYLGIASLLL